MWSSNISNGCPKLLFTKNQFYLQLVSRGSCLSMVQQESILLTIGQQWDVLYMKLNFNQEFQNYLCHGPSWLCTISCLLMKQNIIYVGILYMRKYYYYMPFNLDQYPHLVYYTHNISATVLCSFFRCLLYSITFLGIRVKPFIQSTGQIVLILLSLNHLSFPSTVFDFSRLFDPVIEFTTTRKLAL